MNRNLFAWMLLLPLLSLGSLNSLAQDNASPLQVKIQELYIGILGRAADSPGLDYWHDQISSGPFTLENTRAAFTDPAQTEYTEIYGGLNNTRLVTAIYENFLERAPDNPGLVYWVDELDTGSVNPDQMINAVINAVQDPGATGVQAAKDLAALANKTAAAVYFTAQTSGLPFDDTLRDAARAAVADVTDDPTTLTTAQTLTDCRVCDASTSAQSLACLLSLPLECAVILPKK
jgi:hypothetical protein